MRPDNARKKKSSQEFITISNLKMTVNQVKSKLTWKRGKSLYLNCFWHINFQILLHIFAKNSLEKHFCEQNQEIYTVNSRYVLKLQMPAYRSPTSNWSLLYILLTCVADVL